MEPGGSQEPNIWSISAPEPSTKRPWLFVLLLLSLSAVGLWIAFGKGSPETAWPAAEPDLPPHAIAPAPPAIVPATPPKQVPPTHPSAPLPQKKKEVEPEPVRPTADAYGDPLPDRAIARMGSVRFLTGPVADRGEGFNHGHLGRMAFSPDGQFLATHLPGWVVIWNQDGTRQAEIELPRNQRGIDSLAFSPDGRLFLTGHEDQTVTAWNAWTGRQVWKRTLNNYPYGIESISFSPDGTQVAVEVRGERDGIALLDAASGRVSREIPFKHSSSVDWFPDGKRLLSVISSMGSVIPLEDPSKARTVALPVKDAPFSAVLADAGRLVVGMEKDSYVRVFDAETFEQVLEIHYEFEIRGFDLDGDRRTLFVFLAEDRHRKRIDEVLIYDLPSRRMIRALQRVNPGYVRVGRPRPVIDPALIRVMPMPLSGSCAVVTPDGERIVTADPGLNWWSSQDGAPVGHWKRHEQPIRRLSFDPSGRTLYALGGDLRAWDVKTGTHRATLTLTGVEQCLSRAWTKEGTHFAQALAVAFSRDGRQLAYADRHGYLNVVGTEDPSFSATAYALAGQCPCDGSFSGSAPPFLHAFHLGLLDLVFSADEKELIVVDTDAIRFYPVKDGRAANTPRTLATSRIEWQVGFAQSPDRRWLVANAEKGVHVYDLEKMEERGRGPVGPPPNYYGGSVIFSPDGQELILGVDWKTQKPFRWRFLEEAYPWPKPAEHEHAEVLASSAQGRWATAVPVVRKEGKRTDVTCSIKLGAWGVEGWQGEFRGHQCRITALAFSADGRYLASGDAAGEILIWDTQAPSEPGDADRF